MILALAIEEYDSIGKPREVSNTYASDSATKVLNSDIECPKGKKSVDSDEWTYYAGTQVLQRS